MLLTCPTCRTGLQVPEGTTAHVRCPTCRTIFPAADGLAPPPAEPAPRPRAEDRPRRALRDDEDDRPRRAWRDDEDDRPRKRRRDDDHRGADDRPRKRRRYNADAGKPGSDEKRRLREAFGRGMWGARLIQVSLLFYIPAVLLVPLQTVIVEITHRPAPGYLVIAGLFGLLNWLLGAVGLGLCLSGPVAPGLYRFGISAAVVIAVHAILLLAVVSKTVGEADFRSLDRPSAQWGQLATQYGSLSFYLAHVVYPDEIPVKQSDTAMSFVTGVAEMTRLVLILMTLACVAHAAGDMELSHRCTRMAGRVSLIPGMMALGMLAYKVVVIETGAEQQGQALVWLLKYLYRGINTVVAGILLVTFRTVRDVAEACEFPFQSEIDLGGTYEGGETLGGD